MIHNAVSYKVHHSPNENLLRQSQIIVLELELTLLKMNLGKDPY